MENTGVIIARFQTPYLHEGHFSLINYVKERHSKIVIVLGVSPLKNCRKNPLDFYTREKLVRQHYPEITILPLSDTKYDARWSSDLDHLLSITLPHENFVLYGSHNNFIPYYSGKFEVSKPDRAGDVNASLLRDETCNKALDTIDFRCGIIYSNYNAYPKIYATVDMAVFRDNKKQVLLAQKESEGKWRLPGGFSDPVDADFEAAALRELREECGDIVVDDVRYEKSFKVDDWRYRNEEDKIITTLFSSSLVSGDAKADDDICKVDWFDLSQISNLLNEGKVVQEHIPLINYLISKYVIHS
ncbi:MAG TPA: NUDIX domain-containing protein [Cytophagaceae bacterium]|nr:NUDIX domain-containing protein [Cytophagaceae bacterium]